MFLAWVIYVSLGFGFKLEGENNRIYYVIRLAAKPEYALGITVSGVGFLKSENNENENIKLVLEKSGALRLRGDMVGNGRYICYNYETGRLEECTSDSAPGGSFELFGMKGNMVLKQKMVMNNSPVVVKADEYDPNAELYRATLTNLEGNTSEKDEKLFLLNVIKYEDGIVAERTGIRLDN